MIKKRLIALTAATILSLSLFAGCAQKQATNTTTPPATTDATTTASIVKDDVAFEKAISKDGKWIIATLNDLTINKDLVLDGSFVNGKKDTAGKDIVQRKIALYTQDADRKVTARFTLTAPKLTINSPNASIQHGTFKGDIYVNVPNFQLVDNKVEGNIYFVDEAAKSTFKMDATSTVSGKQEIKK